MNQQTDRKLLLRVILKLMFMGSVLLVAFVLYRYSFKINDNKEKITQDLSELTPGEYKIICPGNRPVMILHRTKSMLETIKSGHDENPFLVIYALSPDYSCPLSIIQPTGTEQGGFKAECSGTLYDFSGVLLLGQNARFNLEKPDYLIDSAQQSIAIHCSA